MQLPLDALPHHHQPHRADALWLAAQMAVNLVPAACGQVVGELGDAAGDRLGIGEDPA